MKCPTCPDDTLVMTERAGVEIDYCPACRGVWLDRGELDKIIERSNALAAPPVAAPEPGRSSVDRAGIEPRRDEVRGPADVVRDDRYDRDHDPRHDDRYDDRYDRSERDSRDRGGRRPPRRRESLLSELFDF